MQKAHDASKNNYWRNLPEITTPIVAEELNRNESSVDEIDNRVVSFDTTKANQTDMLLALKSVTFNSSTGVFTFTKFNDTSVTIDTDIEKIAINFDYDDDPTSAHYQQLIITLDDGTVKYIDLSALITEYEFVDTPTIHFSTSQAGAITAQVIDGSITEAKLEPNFLADILIEVDKAQGFAKDSEAWAVGKRGGVDVPSTDETYQNNSKYYSTQASQSSTTASQAAVAAQGILEEIEEVVGETVFTVNFVTGELEYTSPGYTFSINATTGNLEWEVVTA